ncbi:MAG TPA: hypothetical protein DEA08_27275, partial [Planctomycetes bacterium]|nr:hypothetical protein [Planctomycetota bacterium]
MSRPAPRRARAGVLALGVALALLWAASPAQAHVVANGVGAQSELRVSPRRIELRFNLGFSSLLGLGQLKRMDRNEDGYVDAAEEERYLGVLIEELRPHLKLTLDGEPLQLRVVEQRGLGILGPIEQVGFDTWYELVAEVELGEGAHELRYVDGSGEVFPNENSEHLLWVIEGEGRFQRFELSQERPAGPPKQTSEPGVRGLRGSDLSWRFAFSGEALADDRALALLEPGLAGLSATQQALRERLAQELTEPLNAAALTGVRFAGQGQAEASFAQGAPMAAERVARSAGEEPARGATPAGPAGERGADEPPQSEADAFIAAYRQPFSLAVLAIFLVWGMGHALMPGHGKTMVAAYLLGTEGRVMDAVRLGLIVTITHTIALYTVGLLIVHLVTESQWSSFLKLTAQRLTLLSGLGLIAYGLYLGRQRWQLLKAMAAVRKSTEAGGGEHAHEHTHDAEHAH